MSGFRKSEPRGKESAKAVQTEGRGKGGPDGGMRGKESRQRDMGKALSTAQAQCVQESTTKSFSLELTDHMQPVSGF